MAYGNYFPQSYYPNYYGNQQMPPQQPQMASNAQQSSGSGIIWVQGENAAKAYPVASGQSVLLMDSEDSVMYIKSTDQSGMPQPLRIFEYKEKTGHQNASVIASKPSEDYVSRKEFEAFRDDVRREIKGIRIGGEGEG
jgi:hypothetical protein